MRWPSLLLLVTALAAVVVVRVTRRRWWRVGLLGVTASLGAVAGVAWWAFPIPRFPAPTGPAGVGTTVVQWTDVDRLEEATTSAGDRRTVVAQIWYPAVPGTGAGAALYLGRNRAEARVVADGLASTFGAPAALLDGPRRASARAQVDATPARGRAPWPVVLFSPGLSGVRTQNTAWAEELASHGYVVVALDHLYDSAIVVLADGTSVPTHVRSTGDREADERAAAEWTATRSADLRFVRARIRSDLPLGLSTLVDDRRVAVAGHSIGGASALQAALDDPSAFVAAVDLDGFPRNVAGRSLGVPALFVVAGRGTGNPTSDRAYAEERARVLAASMAPGYELTVDGAAHLSFTDAPLFLPPWPDLVGSGGRRRFPATTAAATRAFLDDVAGRGDPGELAEELRRFGQLQVWPAAARS